MMKSEIEARPVYLKKQNTIYGYFLVCYLSVVLIRILQLKILNDEDSYQEIFKFICELKYTVVKNSYVSMIRSGKMLDKMVKLTGLPINNFILSDKQIE